MSIGINKLFEDGGTLADQRRLLPAVQAFKEAQRLTKIPGVRAWATYDLGTVYWHHLGDGLAARHEFLSAITDFETYGYGQLPNLKTVHADALENAMLCALSFEEFENLAARLQTVAPGVLILTDLVPEVRNCRERGDTWADILFDLAGRNYNRNDSRRDAGRYGVARSTYHLILAHRRELRLSDEDWGMAIFEFCALSMRMVTDCMKVRGDDNDPNSPEEFLPILTEAIPFVDEYLKVNSGDDKLIKVHADMELIVNNIRQRWASLNERVNTMPQRTYFQVCQKCGKVYSRLDEDRAEWMMPQMFLHDSKVCLKCGGNVVWQDSPELRPRFGQGCLTTLPFLSLLAGLVILWLK